MMKYEKSCGFVVYRNDNNLIKYLLIQACNGEYGFPKGHVENNETEHETAIRELKEETNLDVNIIDGFRHPTEYLLPNKKDVMKQSVYFLGECISDDIVCQEGEVSKALFVSFEEAMDLLSYESTKNVLKEANELILHKNQV